MVFGLGDVRCSSAWVESVAAAKCPAAAVCKLMAFAAHGGCVGAACTLVGACRGACVAAGGFTCSFCEWL